MQKLLKKIRLGYKLAKLSCAGIQVHRDVDVHLAILAGEIKMAGEDSRPYFDLIFEVRLEWIRLHMCLAIFAGEIKMAADECRPFLDLVSRCEKKK
jgi:hypothetical protein